MTEYVALLRGVNVGKANRIAMAQLRELISELGYGNPRTLLNSGNAVFEATPAQARTASTKLRTALKDKANVTSTVMLRSADELRTAIANNPLLDVVTDPSRHLIGFLSEEPSAEAQAKIAAIDLPPDEIRLIGCEVFLWMTEGVLKSRLSTSGWEKMLGTDVTARNLNTVLKLEQLLA